MFRPAIRKWSVLPFLAELMEASDDELELWSELAEALPLELWDHSRMRRFRARKEGEAAGLVPVMPLWAAEAVTYCMLGGWTA